MSEAPLVGGQPDGAPAGTRPTTEVILRACACDSKRACLLTVDLPVDFPCRGATPFALGARLEEDVAEPVALVGTCSLIRVKTNALDEPIGGRSRRKVLPVLLCKRIDGFHTDH